MTFGTHSTHGTGVRSSPWKPTAAKSLHAAPADTYRLCVGMGRWPARWHAVRTPAAADSAASPTRLRIFRPASGTIAPPLIVRSSRESLMFKLRLMTLLIALMTSTVTAVAATRPMSELKPLATIHVGATADWVAITPDAVWVGSTDPNAVHRIDPKTNEPIAPVKLTGAPCAG